MKAIQRQLLFLGGATFIFVAIGIFALGAVDRSKKQRLIRDEGEGVIGALEVIAAARGGSFPLQLPPNIVSISDSRINWTYFGSPTAFALEGSTESFFGNVRVTYFSQTDEWVDQS